MGARRTVIVDTDHLGEINSAPLRFARLQKLVEVAELAGAKPDAIVRAGGLKPDGISIEWTEDISE